MAAPQSTFMPPYPYNLWLPTQLPPLVQVPATYTSAFTSGLAEVDASLGAEPELVRTADQNHAPAFSIQPAKPDSAIQSHSWHSPHIDLSSKLHLPHFSLRHGAAVNHQHHWPHFSLPAIAWPHPLSHGYTPRPTSWVPAADVKEMQNRYVIDIEVPGLEEGKEQDVLVQWMSPRTLVVSADSKRTTKSKLVTIPPAGDTNRGGETDSKGDDDEEGAELTRTQSHSEEPETNAYEQESEQPCQFMIAERHVGYWRRSFTLSADIDFGIDPNISGSGKSPRYQIEAGVLIIEIPKKE